MLCGVPVAAYDGLGETISETWCVMNAETGQVLISKDADKKMNPASITKILTCAIALENLNPDDEYTFSAEAASYDQGSTHLAFSEGETCTIRDLLYGAMVESANDCAMGLADAVSGSQYEFVKLMNSKLAELGCENSHFANSTGMPDSNHYTTARDMSLITKYAMETEGFNTYFSAWEWTIPETNKNSERHFGTHHSMIVGSENNSVYGYDYAFGGKLGWTEESQHTMVTAAEKDGMTLICTVLKSKNKQAKYKDTIMLFDYCFENFREIEIPVEITKAKISIYDGTEYYGEMTVYPVATVKILASDDITEENLRAVSNIPKECDYSQISDVGVNVIFDTSSDRMDTETMKVTPMYYIIKESETREEEADISGNEQRSEFRWWIFIIIPAGFLMFILLVIICIRAYNINKYRKMRKHRHYSHLKDGK